MSYIDDLIYLGTAEIEPRYISITIEITELKPLEHYCGKIYTELEFLRIPKIIYSVGGREGFIAHHNFNVWPEDEKRTVRGIILQTSKTAKMLCIEDCVNFVSRCRCCNRNTHDVYLHSTWPKKYDYYQQSGKERKISVEELHAIMDRVSLNYWQPRGYDLKGLTIEYLKDEGIAIDFETIEAIRNYQTKPYGRVNF